MSLILKSDYKAPPCAIEGCKGDSAWRVPFCPGHWLAIPKRIQREIKKYRQIDPLVRTKEHIGVIVEATKAAMKGDQ
jgi:hypothetical protein